LGGSFQTSDPADGFASATGCSAGAGEASEGAGDARSGCGAAGDSTIGSGASTTVTFVEDLRQA
jgi:hypothetical protein